ncbi:hypothetical protein LTR78_003760 [Recurvomyces mirabilis]|uniref:Uncharacterized protein n=1 Tax=Recurvomyces mirabilis TaxID=574656 RepID=A0AAE1C388_9PEZI|nr:hypothetical protein LTR78_003760 [Recurvomyces mirabilis]KAK5154872.1 hypothetical protein LTS14_006453 [Recurvomyces mirabilis]
MAQATDKISDERFLLILFEHKSSKMEWKSIAEQCGMRNGKSVLKKRIEASKGVVGTVNSDGTPKSGKKGNGSKASSMPSKRRAASGNGDEDDEESTPLKIKSQGIKKAKLEACEEAITKAETGSDDGWA